MRTASTSRWAALNPDELLNLARYLASAPEAEAFSTETQWRTAINRAYYAVYTAARNLLADEGIPFTNADASHRQVRDKFRFAHDPIRKQLGILMTMLFDLRCKADYESTTISTTDVTDTLGWTAEALKKIQTLHRRISRS